MYSRYIPSRFLLPLAQRRSASSSSTSSYYHQQLRRRHFGDMFHCFFCRTRLREHGAQLARLCARQFEFVAAQRVRRSLQIFQLYSKIWDEVALREFARSWRRRLARKARDFLVGAVGVSVYNWDQQRIHDKELYSYSQEIDGIHELRDCTTVCPNCHLRLIVDAARPDVQYCQCPNSKYALNKAQEEGIDWLPFLERQDMLVWRKEEQGLYAYKVYGSFNDVTAEDLLQVQIDIDYRKEWDTTAQKLEIIDTEPLTKNVQGSQTEVVYWEMVWPRFFANRDYVYQRRWLYDKKKDVIIIVNKGVDHPNAPDRQDTYRVKTYWSCMVIKPYKSISEPGIEFGLTYFEDPGVSIPSAVTSWVAMSGLPDYLCRMREAGKNYKSYKASLKTENIKTKSIQINDDRDSDKSLLSVNNDIKQIAVPENSDSDTNTKDQTQEDSIRQPTKTTSEDNTSEGNKTEEQEESSDADSQDDYEPGFLDYFFRAKLFA
ncbi:stAR-related lipid transfer protein 7, mitochondrial-like isoform X1 [Trichogramma pretiosum]|uniref:stAR-related lipid transfer protein 7, mitochondrial-like isoform X1 n=1 Tax=Trichogramma pretiosum TaxID=7493 RepID=UPI0006C979E3|nr:stAR-related lipid transfer protein 7, mitochondrial-like isoform X1 [Trichogramma pretiosum]